MKTFDLTITSVTHVFYDGEAGFCGIITPDGSMGFEARHEPVLAVLKENSLVRYRDGVGQEHSVSAASGILSFRGNRCTITLDPAEAAS